MTELLGNMSKIRYMIVMETLEQCYRFMKFKHIHPRECVIIPLSMSRDIQYRFKGYYNQIMNNEIELLGITKEQFAKLYFRNPIEFEQEYKRTHGFVEKELKSSLLANKKLKIVKGYLKGNFIVIEDWWQKVVGTNWQTSAFGNPAAYNYCLNHQGEYSNYTQSVNWVLYGKIDGLGYLVNVNELECPKDYNPKEDYIMVEKEVSE